MKPASRQKNKHHTPMGQILCFTAQPVGCLTPRRQPCSTDDDAYIFGAICPDEGGKLRTRAGHAAAWCDTDAMAAHLIEISARRGRSRLLHAPVADRRSETRLAPDSTQCWRWPQQGQTISRPGQLPATIARVEPRWRMSGNSCATTWLSKAGSSKRLVAQTIARADATLNPIACEQPHADHTMRRYMSLRRSVADNGRMGSDQ